MWSCLYVEAFKKHWQCFENENWENDEANNLLGFNDPFPNVCVNIS